MYNPLPPKPMPCAGTPVGIVIALYYIFFPVETRVCWDGDVKAAESWGRESLY